MWRYSLLTPFQRREAGLDFLQGRGEFGSLLPEALHLIFVR
jgi:hypothetical protein